MKIGIVTQPLNRNYGGILQNYALQTVLRHLGHTPVTIDYMWSLRWYRYLISTIKTALVWCIPGHRRDFVRFRPKRKIKKLDDFISRHISTTGYVYKYTESIIDKYNLEAVVTGSDQVWRPMYNPDLKDMYLDFVRNDDIRRIAYAASFGTSELEYTNDIIRSCRKAADRLTAVSVREESGVTLCREYFAIKAEHVLDPTLLLSKEDYMDLSSGVPRHSHRYIGTYILDEKPIYKEVAEKIRDNTPGLGMRSVEGNDKSLSPDEWIALFRDAEFIITDSFHGTVFSIIFQKPFITFCNHSRGADRFRSLLAPLGLMDRLVDYDSCDPDRLIDQKIDWDKVGRLLSEKRVESIGFIERSLI